MTFVGMDALILSISQIVSERVFDGSLTVTKGRSRREENGFVEFGKFSKTITGTVHCTKYYNYSKAKNYHFNTTFYRLNVTPQLLIIICPLRLLD